MSDCDVCLGRADYEPAVFYSESTPKARKEHECCECGAKIQRGSTYFRASGKWDGELQTYHQCMPCHEIQITFACGDGYFYTTLWEDMNEYVFENLKVSSPCFNKLSMEARAFLTEKWWKWKEANR